MPMEMKTRMRQRTSQMTILPISQGKRKRKRKGKVEGGKRVVNTQPKLRIFRLVLPGCSI